MRREPYYGLFKIDAGRRSKLGVMSYSGARDLCPRCSRPVYAVKDGDGQWRGDDFLSLSVGVFKPAS